MFSGASFELQKVRLAPGDTLITFTDGVPDARNPENKHYTEKRLLELVAIPAATSEELLKRIEEDLFAHISTADQFDDVTMLIARRKA
jgi:sigma-B regulation protein RsbU (phosphoserine phosphatase)